MVPDETEPFPRGDESRVSEINFRGNSSGVLVKGVGGFSMYLELSQGETTAGADAAVVLDG